MLGGVAWVRGLTLQRVAALWGGAVLVGETRVLRLISQRVAALLGRAALAGHEEGEVVAHGSRCAPSAAQHAPQSCTLASSRRGVHSTRDAARLRGSHTQSSSRSSGGGGGGLMRGNIITTTSSIGGGGGCGGGIGT